MNPVPVKLIIKLNDLLDHQFAKFTECNDYLQTLGPSNPNQKKFADILVRLYGQFMKNVKHSEKYNGGKIRTLSGNYIDSSYNDNDNVVKKLVGVYVPVIVMLITYAQVLLSELAITYNQLPIYILPQNCFVASLKSLLDYPAILREMGGYQVGGEFVKMTNEICNHCAKLNTMMNDYETANESFVAKFIAGQNRVVDKGQIEKVWMGVYGTRLYTGANVDIKNIVMGDVPATGGWWNLVLRK